MLKLNDMGDNTCHVPSLDKLIEYLDKANKSDCCGVYFGRLFNELKGFKGKIRPANGWLNVLREVANKFSAWEPCRRPSTHENLELYRDDTDYYLARNHLASP